ncbi:MAG: CBS domain-containing protein [Clostridiales bacterium]|uniref:CBS domain-containing protein n=1 Tax=Clostridium sp. N3C TaxID=1776758 RepID=UPI00092DF6F7|nr:CBS domain-containing protein [Clostridium sp. N3C]NLZ48166.1 CBS domain-containing protein [Clostridiales bacterium]SCN22273.1 putative manganese-dependent inorganic pyrophosphatase [Clostridium sp. N3C]
MNIAFFLTPKSDVVWEDFNSTMRQAMEKMEYHSYTAIPLLDGKGRYVGTLTEGDLLWMLKNNPDLTFNNLNKIKISEIKRHMNNKPVTINSDIESLISLAVNQNFVPVVDDHGTFIGIIKRSDIINYCYEKFINER